LLDSGNHGPEPFFGDGLQKIGDRVGVERRERMLVVRGHEDDERRDFRRECFDDFESAQPRHFDIEEHDLRPVLSNRFQRRQTIVRVSLDEIERVRREQLPQPRSGRSLVVGNQRFNLHAAVSRW
jgi:hypothetical protein